MKTGGTTNLNKVYVRNKDENKTYDSLKELDKKVKGLINESIKLK